MWFHQTPKMKIKGLKRLTLTTRVKLPMQHQILNPCGCVRERICYYALVKRLSSTEALVRMHGMRAAFRLLGVASGIRRLSGTRYCALPNAHIYYFSMTGVMSHCPISRTGSNRASIASIDVASTIKKLVCSSRFAYRALIVMP
jgi:hypothetical protein